MDKTASFSVGWVDALIAILLVVGVMRGRKRGMSEELLDIIKWLVIVVVGAAFYQPLGQFLKQVSLFSLLSCYVAVYGFIILSVMLLFSFIKRSVGDKLVGSDTFGSAEYYLGMAGGFFRYLCVIVVGMAFLNARYYSPAEVQAKSKYQQDNFGSSFFLTLPDLQREVFVESFTGHAVREFLPIALIKPTAGADATDQNDSIGRRRENTINEITAKKKKRLDQRR
jgi:uncharacterized membrane protein required for colicin V production